MFRGTWQSPAGSESFFCILFYFHFATLIFTRLATNASYNNPLLPFISIFEPFHSLVVLSHSYFSLFSGSRLHTPSDGHKSQNSTAKHNRQNPSNAEKSLKSNKSLSILMVLLSISFSLLPDRFHLFSLLTRFQEFQIP